MSKFVVITKRASDFPNSAQFKGLPPAYPAGCQEFETLAEAQEHHPQKEIMTIEQYKGYQTGMNMLFSHYSRPKPWWKFWGKS